MGDFNINLLCDNSTIVKYKESLESFGVISLINFPTRFMNKQTSSLLNHIYCNDNSSDIISGTVSFDISDHNPTFVLTPNKQVESLSKKLNHLKIFKRNFFLFSECDFLKTLEENLNNRNLGKNKLDPEEDFLNFLNTFLNCLETHAPTQKLTRKETKFYFKSWLTKSIQNSIKKKLYQLSSQHAHSESYYKQYNNILTKVKQRSKQNCFQHHLQLSKNNTKETWKTINQIIRKPTCHTIFTKIKCIDTNIDLYDPKHISSCFNKYFSCVSSNLAHALPKASSSNSMKSISFICSSMYIKPVYIEDIINEINQLDTNKCDDTYDIPVKIIKLSKVIIAPILCNLINNCINKGIFPSILKIAKVILIYKNGEKDLVSNYRPIFFYLICPKFLKKF